MNRASGGGEGRGRREALVRRHQALSRKELSDPFIGSFTRGIFNIEILPSSHQGAGETWKDSQIRRRRLNERGYGAHDGETAGSTSKEGSGPQVPSLPSTQGGIHRERPDGNRVDSPTSLKT